MTLSVSRLDNVTITYTQVLLLRIYPLCDLTVVQRVAEEHLQDYLVSIMDKETTNNDHWKRELHNLLGVQIDYEGQTAMVYFPSPLSIV